MSFQQNEFSAFKLLLKQVYSAHTSKVRDLENEVKTLKEQLFEKVREPDSVLDCKRCAELEEAFKSCKEALHEQSKWFETFGKKFSIFNVSGEESQDLKLPAKLLNCKSESTKISESINADVTKCDENKSSFFIVEENVSNMNNTDTTLKPSVVSNNQNLLKNIMYAGASLDSLDMCTAIFPQNVKGQVSNVTSDCAILVPDSLDVDLDVRKGVKRASTDSPSGEGSHKKISNVKDSKTNEEISNHQKVTETSKRLSSETLKESRLKKCDLNDRRLEDSNVTKSMIVKHSIVQKKILSNFVSKPVINEKSRDDIKDLEPKICEVTQVSNDLLEVSKKVLSNIKSKHIKDEKNETDVKDSEPKVSEVTQVGNDVLEIPKKAVSNIKSKHIMNEKNKYDEKDLEEKNCQVKSTNVFKVMPCNDINSNATSKSNLCLNAVKEVKKVNSPHETSPSLLPMNAPTSKIMDTEAVANDNDDFIEHVSCSKPSQYEDSWDTCDKRKTLKKSRAAKTIKCTSKYKMTLDAPPLNYKKPTYKQVKLTKNFFQGKQDKANSNKKMPEKSQLGKKDGSLNQEKDFIPTIILDELQISTPLDAINSPSPVDIDATFIPDNYKYEVTQCGTSAVKKNAVEKSHLRNGSLFSNISFPGELKSGAKCEISDIEEVEDSPSFEDVEYKENMDSFDRLPVPEEPNFKYKNDVVRKKSERKQLEGFECKECEKYYSELGLTNKEKKERMKKCSRHRAKFAPPSTPDHFWELEFPDTQECKARGYMNKTQKVSLNNLCDI